MSHVEKAYVYIALPAFDRNLILRKGFLMSTISALFVDYDNIHISLGNIDPRLASAFEKRPLDWMSILQNADVEGEPIRRNFAIRRCYANPDHMGRYRINYTQSAFEVVDCPPLTSRGKNSADIYMVMDIMDTLSDFPHVEEFVIMSADSDFTPVITRLRKHLKRTVIYENQNTARSYRNSSDLVINESDFVDLLSDCIPNLAAPARSASQTTAQSAQTRAAPAPVKRPLTPEALKIQSALKDLILEQSSPLQFSNAAQELRSRLGEEPCRKWGGFNMFTKLVNAIALPGIKIDMESGGVFLVEDRMNDPSYRIGQSFAVDEFVENAGIDPALAAFAAQVGVATKIPRLLPSTYAKLFEAIVAVLNRTSGPSLELTKNVLGEMQAHSRSIDKASIMFVIRGIATNGHRISSADDPRFLSGIFEQRVEELCAAAGVQVDAKERQMLRQWICPGAEDSAATAAPQSL